jgi:hypothetical protein
MNYWNGARWLEDEPSGPRPRPSRAANWAATAAMLIGLAAILAPLQLIAAASHRSSDSGCTVNPATADVGEVYVVSAWGIPTGTAVNLWVTENGVTTGSPLGSTPDGKFDLNEWSNAPGVTTYAFSGPTKKHMAMYATCSVSAY